MYTQDLCFLCKTWSCFVLWGFSLYCLRVSSACWPGGHCTEMIKILDVTSHSCFQGPWGTPQTWAVSPYSWDISNFGEYLHFRMHSYPVLGRAFFAFPHRKNRHMSTDLLEILRGSRCTSRESWPMHRRAINLQRCNLAEYTGRIHPFSNLNQLRDVPPIDFCSHNGQWNTFWWINQSRLYHK